MEEKIEMRSIEEKEEIKREKEKLLEQGIKSIHRKMYEDANIKMLLGTNEKLYLLCGLIMAGMTAEGISPLEPSELVGNDSLDDNDGEIILRRTKDFLSKKGCPQRKIDIVINYLRPVFSKQDMWRPVNGESAIHSLYAQVKSDIIPLLEGDVYLDFTGKILDSLSEWVSIENDKLNDVVLTPRFVASLMARITRINMNSFVWDTCMGSSEFLVSAMEQMIEDAKANIKDADELEAKIKNIKRNQILGIEVLGNVYILAVLNMILMGDGSSQIICGDSHKEGPKFIEEHRNDFPANVFLLNPPYSAPGKGLAFVDEALSQMENGYGAVLIQENAGSGQGTPYAKRILEKSTLLASIHMPHDLFCGKASVQTAIYLFKANRPHKPDDIVQFIDFSKDGYSRQSRKKSAQNVNLKNTDHAIERYEEVAALCLGEKPKTSYYTEENELVIRDTISLKGDDWTFRQHKKISLTPTEEDFKKVVSDYLAWKVGEILKGHITV